MNEVITMENEKIEVEEPIEIAPFNGRYMMTRHENNWDSKGTRLIATFWNMPVYIPVFEDIYQRALEKQRLKQLRTMIQEAGRPWDTMTITLNPRRAIVDGNHRIVTLKDLGYPTIPQVNMMDFKDIVAESEYFIDINKMSSRIKKDHYIWRARFVAKQMSALILYSLVDADEESMLFDRVSTAERASTKNRIAINTAWHIICKCGLNYQSKFEIDKEPFLIERIEKVGYGSVKQSVNEFMTWFLRSFKEKDQKNPAWKNKCFLAFIQYFNLLKKKGMLSTESRYKQTLKKNNEFSINASLLELDQHNILRELVTHFNHKKKVGNKFKLDIPTRN